MMFQAAVYLKKNYLYSVRFIHEVSKQLQMCNQLVNQYLENKIDF